MTFFKSGKFLSLLEINNLILGRVKPIDLILIPNSFFGLYLFEQKFITAVSFSKAIKP